MGYGSTEVTSRDIDRAVSDERYDRERECSNLRSEIRELRQNLQSEINSLRERVDVLSEQIDRLQRNNTPDRREAGHL